MLSKVVAAAVLLAGAHARVCPPVVPVLPLTGGKFHGSPAVPVTLPGRQTDELTQRCLDPAQVLPPIEANQRLLKIAIGHGIQNYTCADAGANVTTAGALAVLYDITHLYPGTKNTGLPAENFNSLATTVLWSQDIPLNLQNPALAFPGSPSNPNAGSEASYGAVVANPWLPPADLTLGGLTIPFLGRHYFDISNSPTFDLTSANLLASVSRGGGCKAPATADKGVLGTGAVDWLQLKDNGKGISRGVSFVYRVITVGGVSQSCATLAAPKGSVPYTAFYWFFGV